MREDWQRRVERGYNVGIGSEGVVISHIIKFKICYVFATKVAHYIVAVWIMHATLYCCYIDC
jgi:hypothetical protein